LFAHGCSGDSGKFNRCLALTEQRPEKYILGCGAHGLREGLVFSHLNNQRKDHNAHSNCAEDGRQAVKDDTANRKVSEAEHNADYE